MKLGQEEYPVQNDMLKVGELAPDFTLTANNWSIKIAGGLRRQGQDHQRRAVAGYARLRRANAALQ